MREREQMSSCKMIEWREREREKRGSGRLTIEIS